MTQVTETSRLAAPLGAPGETCVQCGAVLAEDQRYCLNCGTRRGPSRVAYEELLLTSPTAPGDGASQPPAGPASRTISPLGAAAALGLLLLAVLVGAVIGSTGKSDTPAPVVNVASGGGATGPTGPATFTGDWTGTGWTVELQALPKAANQPAQVAQAEQAATAKGATGVGALDSDAYASLPPGNYVVYAGHYSARSGAQNALGALTVSFPDAAVVRVSTTAAAATGAGAAAGAAKGAATKSTTTAAPKKTTKALNDLKNSSPQDYSKTSKKLPNSLSTGGDTLPQDNQAPGGGQGGETIG